MYEFLKHRTDKTFTWNVNWNAFHGVLVLGIRAFWTSTGWYQYQDYTTFGVFLAHNMHLRYGVENNFLFCMKTCRNDSLLPPHKKAGVSGRNILTLDLWKYSKFLCPQHLLFTDSFKYFSSFSNCWPLTVCLGFLHPTGQRLMFTRPPSRQGHSSSLWPPASPTLTWVSPQRTGPGRRLMEVTAAVDVCEWKWLWVKENWCSKGCECDRRYVQKEKQEKSNSFFLNV